MQTKPICGMLLCPVAGCAGNVFAGWATSKIASPQQNMALQKLTTRNLLFNLPRPPWPQPSRQFLQTLQTSLLQEGFTLRSASRQDPVGSYPTFSPLPRDRLEAVYFLRHCPSRGISSAVSQVIPRDSLPCAVRTFLDAETPRPSPAGSR